MAADATIEFSGDVVLILLVLILGTMLGLQLRSRRRLAARMAELDAQIQNLQGQLDQWRREAGGATARIPSERPQATETVLLVDDEPAVRGLVREVLRRHGYTVVEAADGATGLRLCAEYPAPIHLVLTDVVMPGMGGREMAQQAARLRPRLRFLFMSGYTEDPRVRDDLMQPGAAFLQKPFTPGVLTRRVREVLDHAPGGQDLPAAS
jgi:CheY-like chemotaxis protein